LIDIRRFAPLRRIRTPPARISCGEGYFRGIRCRKGDWINCTGQRICAASATLDVNSSASPCSSQIRARRLSVWLAREAKNVETYGSARWARDDEVKAAGLLGADGVVLGKLDRNYLRHDGPEHVLCFAPTRSGKGVGLVAPSLLTWPGSAIVHDIKCENWTLTAGFSLTIRARAAV
jgi:type IV secretory pathway TraG/TraD family ATPase VirD4